MPASNETETHGNSADHVGNSTNKYTLIAFASHWGSKYGGINAFNADFLEAMSIAYYGKVQIVCVVCKAEPGDIEDAKNKKITLVPLPYESLIPCLGEEQAQVAIKAIAEKNIRFTPEQTIWLGHDRISGGAALEAAKEEGGRSVLIHHMSYKHYGAFAENSQAADEKVSQQKKLFKAANLVMAVGPVLKDALEDMTDRDVYMLVPGLANIEPKRKIPNTFSMFVSGRLSKDASKIKQSQLSVAAFSQCYKQAKKQKQPESLLNRPRLFLRGVDFELTEQQDSHYFSSEQDLQKFAEEYADAAINLQALPYTTDRQLLFDDLKASSVAAMPSWHEGFGLVAWEAIAAGVPIILSKESGVYKLIKEKHVGFEESFVWAVNINGKVDAPYFSDLDLSTVCSAITGIAIDPNKAREKAMKLRGQLAQYTWSNYVEKVVDFFNWDITKGVIDEARVEHNYRLPESSEPLVSTNDEQEENGGLFMPKPGWDPKQGMAVSVLLRASEAVVPFDGYRKPELDKLATWALDTTYPVSIRLITGEGGAGKTRLATELCHQLKKYEWYAGFLQKNMQQHELAEIWQRLKVVGKPCVIAIDYAETQTDELLVLLQLILNTAEKEKICILLLARDSGEWWDNLPAKDSETEALLSGRATTGPYRLSPLYKTLEQKQQAYQNSLEAFSKILYIEGSVCVKC